jgi:hypothetical protein
MDAPPVHPPAGLIRPASQFAMSRHCGLRWVIIIPQFVGDGGQLTSRIFRGRCFRSISCRLRIGSLNGMEGKSRAWQSRHEIFASDRAFERDPLGQRTGG